MLKYCLCGKSKSLQFVLLILHPLAQNKSDTEKKTLVQQLPSCLGLKLSYLVILLKANNLCTSRDISFMCSSGIFWHDVNMTYGKTALCCLWRCPVFHKPLDVFSVCTPEPSVCLVKGQPASVAHERSGCLCFVCPVMHVP